MPEAPTGRRLWLQFLRKESAAFPPNPRDSGGSPRRDSMEEASTDIAQSTKLYALLLKLRPLERGTIMPFSGELVHGAWLNWLRETAPDVADRLHEGNKRRLFTCSNLQFPYTSERIMQAQRENVHLPLDPQKSFLLEEVISHPDDPSGWTGFTTCETLVEQARTRRLLPAQPLEMEFASITAFNRIHHSSRPYGNHYARLPLPSYVFAGLASRWQEIAPPALTHVVQLQRIEAYIEAQGVIIDDYQLQTHSAHFAQHTQPGFVGTCRYLLRGPDAPPTAEQPLTLRQQILLLSWLAFYTGVGYKPAMGMGQTRALPG